MKKMILVLMMTIVFSACAFGEDTVSVEIPEFDIRVNGQLIDTEHSKYPMIGYKGIVYFPLTSDYLSGIGLKLNWNHVNGIDISQNEEIGEFSQKFLGSNNSIGSSHYAQIVKFPIKVNGNIVNNSKEDYPVLLFNDITYFPMTWRFAVTEFDWKTNWNIKTGFEIIIDNKKINKDIVNKKAKDIKILDFKIPYIEQDNFSQRNNPARLGDEVNVITTDWDKTVYNTKLKLTNIIRGNEAWKKIYATNMFNDKPAEGFEYMLVEFSANYYGGSDSKKQLNLSAYDFALVSHFGKDYDSQAIVEPEPNLNIKLYQGASHKGYVAFLVSKSDLNPLIAYKKSYDGSSGVWFRGYTSILDVDNNKTGDLSNKSIYTNNRKTYMKQSDFTQRSNPVRLGDEVNVISTDWDNTVYNMRFRLNNIIRGNKAWKMIYDANMFNKEPIKGFEYMLVKFSANYYGGSDLNKQLNLSGYDFTLVSQDGKDYDSQSIVEPEPNLDAKLYQGASHEGYVVFLVSKSDLNPLVVYKKENDSSGGVWFICYDSK